MKFLVTFSTINSYTIVLKKKGRIHEKFLFQILLSSYSLMYLTTNNFTIESRDAGSMFNFKIKIFSARVQPDNENKPVIYILEMWLQVQSKKDIKELNSHY